MALVLLGCSTDDIFLLPNGVGEDGSLEINLSVPEMESVRTRADQFAISSIRMLVFDNDGHLVQLSDDLYDDLTSTGNASDHTYKLKVNLKQEVRSLSGLQFYFIANYADEIIEHLKASTTNEATMLTDVMDVANNTLTYNTPLARNLNIRMSGKATLTHLTEGNAVEIKRNSAKITVNNKAATGDEPGDVSYPFNTYGTADQASIIAGAEGLMAPATEYEIAAEAAAASESEADKAKYVHPTINNIDKAERPFIIIRAPYAGTQYYYRVDFRKIIKDEDTGKETINELDIQPNHWYKFVVTEISGAGDTSEEQAALHPSSLISVDILDVTPKSYNMVTDGTRELGVSHEVVYDETTGSDHKADLYIKMFSLNNDEYPAPTKEAFENLIVSCSDPWFSVSAVEDVTSETEGGNLGDGKGKVYKVTIELDSSTKSPGTLEGEVSVDWKGLNRTVPLIWKREFSGETLCSVKLTINGNTRSVNGDNVTYTDKTVLSNVNYWDFLKTTEGVSAEANMGTARNEGLHFPLMYGYQGHEWEYEYEVTYEKLVDGNFDYKIYTTGSIINVNYEVTGGGVTGGGSGAQVSGTANGNLVVKVTKPTNSWLYTYGEMVLSIYNPNTRKWDDFPIDLYHTGFFHDHGSGSSHDWYYYEVLGDDDNNYWLDRNLLAKSAGACVLDNDGSVASGSDDAIGDYMRPYEYNNSIENKPKLKDNICPPGFMIPREETWNSIRNSANFIKSISSGTYNSYLISNVPGKRIYFPRARYKDSTDALIGEARGGYYWTSTPSVGFEKEELGNWMQAFVISGSITSYIAAELDRSNQGWAMNVRCVNSTSESGNMYRTYFSVSGATHVFLYNESNGKRTAATTWPGKAIGDASTMENGQVMSFVLDSPTTPAENWYVIFNYKDGNGQIHTYSKNGNGVLHSIDQNQSNLTGWKVVGETSVTPTSDIGGTWTIDRSIPSISFQTGNKIDDVVRHTYRIYWPYDAQNWNGIKIYNNAGTFTVGSTSYTAFGNEQSQTNGKYGKYNDSFAYLEFEKTGSQLSGNFYVQLMKGSNQNGARYEITIPGSKDADGIYSYTLKPLLDNGNLNGGANGMPNYFFVNYYDAEGWGEEPKLRALNSSGGLVGSEITGKKLHDYWPALYRYVVDVNTAITQIQFKSTSHTVTGQRDGQSFKDLDNVFFNNGSTAAGIAVKNNIKPDDITALSSNWRIAVRQVSSWNPMYIYTWGGNSNTDNPNDKPMKKAGGGNNAKTYFYRDVANDVTGIIFTNGNWGNNNQTTNLDNSLSTKYKVGKLIDDWYGTPTVQN